MQPEERVERAVELGLVGHQAVRRIVIALQPPLAPPNLIAEVPAAAGEELGPATVTEAEHRARYAAQRPAGQERAPARGGGEVLAEEDVPAGPPRAERITHHPGHARAVLGGADRAELVAGSVTEEPQRPQRPLAPAIQRDHADERSVGLAHGHGHEGVSGAEVPPPRRDPVPRREDVAPARGELLPPGP